MAAAASMGLRRIPKNGIEDTGGDGDAERVVAEGEYQVLVDIADYGATQLDRFDDALQVAFDQGNTGLSIATSVPVPIAIPTFAAAMRVRR